MAVCSNCDTAMDDDAIICIECGFDSRSGSQLQTKILSAEDVESLAVRSGLHGVLGALCILCLAIPLMIFGAMSAVGGIMMLVAKEPQAGMSILMGSICFCGGLSMCIGFSLNQLSVYSKRDTELEMTFIKSILFIPYRKEIKDLTAFHTIELRYTEGPTMRDLHTIIPLFFLGLLPAIWYWKYLNERGTMVAELVGNQERVRFYRGPDNGKWREMNKELTSLRRFNMRRI